MYFKLKTQLEMRCFKNKNYSLRYDACLYRNSASIQPYFLACLKLMLLNIIIITINIYHIKSILRLTLCEDYNPTRYTLDKRQFESSLLKTYNREHENIPKEVLNTRQKNI